MPERRRHLLLYHLLACGWDLTQIDKHTYSLMWHLKFLYFSQPLLYLLTVHICINCIALDLGPHPGIHQSMWSLHHSLWKKSRNEQLYTMTIEDVTVSCKNWYQFDVHPLWNMETYIFSFSSYMSASLFDFYLTKTWKLE